MVQQVKSVLKGFWAREDGNTTVDWVVLLAGILGMVFIVMGSISGGVSVFGNKAGNELAAHEISTY